MKRCLRRVSGVILVAVMAGLMAGCTKSDEEEAKIEIVDGDADQVTFLVGVSANPRNEAKDYCSLYGKQAVFRDVEPAGTQMEAYMTGSRPYLYYFDCI